MNGSQTVLDNSIVIFAQNDETLIEIADMKDIKFLLLTGEPLNEPIQGDCPFVMNSKEEFIQVFDDFNHWEFGKISLSTVS